MKFFLAAIILLLSSTPLIQCSSKTKLNGNSEPNAPNDVSGAIIEDGSPALQRSSKKVSQPMQPVLARSAVEKKLYPPLYAQLNQYIKNQEEEGILKEGSALLMKNPKDIKALNAMAMSYYKRGQYPLAKSLLLRALNTEAGVYEVHSNMGVVQLALGEKNEALKSFKKAIELNPNDYVSASNAGSLYVIEQDFEKATVVLEIAYSKGYRNPKILNNYAVALTATGKYEKADKIYREALKENANERGILFNHAILLIQFLKKNEEGLDIIKKLKFLGVPDEARKKFQDLQTLAERK